MPLCRKWPMNIFDCLVDGFKWWCVGLHCIKVRAPRVLIMSRTDTNIFKARPKKATNDTLNIFTLVTINTQLIVVVCCQIWGPTALWVLLLSLFFYQSSICELFHLFSPELFHLFHISPQYVTMISIVMKVKGDVLSVTITSIKTHRYLRGVDKTIFLICFDLCERCVLLW